ncbi:C40 family peptidase [Lacticaseibacillus brantae]|uniref:Cell wall-associated hydrolase n=1 Tax=Lacticaseibacillus brantae DSM 23927 TaxID=1423727 RepID=A0A0R2B092_9LACO|nr:C40 family peptidase [Lacticaseibacillus brantae]KRM72194.1 cell wall-associated hydrolase [Lacticaseibacillus brantae DSM 23927]
MKNLKKHFVAAATVGFIGLTGIALGSQSNNTVSAAEVGGVITVNYTPGYGIAIWDSPQANHNYLGRKLNHGTAWKVFGKQVVNGKTWYNLGGNQWIDATYTVDGQVSQAPSAVDSVIKLAKQQLGKPYVWGGKGPSAFDCSGLMYYVFKNATGKNIGGYTVPQESAGKQVSINSLKPGDLVFWGSRGATYHVGLYIGNGQYLHAPAPGQGVKIQSLSSFTPSFGVRVL